MPSGYTVKRYIGSWKLDASNALLSARWKGDEYIVLADPVEEFSDTSLTSGSSNVETVAIKAPPEAYVHYTAKLDDGGGTNFTNAEISIGPGDGSWTCHTAGCQYDGADLIQMNAEGWVNTNTSSQIKYFITFSGPASPDLALKILGWRDLKILHP